MFFNYTDLFLKKFVKWLKDKPVFNGFIKLFGYLLDELNAYYNQLYLALIIKITYPNKACIENLLNDLYDPNLRNIKVIGNVGIRNLGTPYAYVKIFIPPNQLDSSTLPSDLGYINEVVNNIVQYGLRPSSAEIVTAYAIAFELAGTNYTISIPDNNGGSKSIAFFQNIEAVKRKIKKI